MNFNTVTEFLVPWYESKLCIYLKSAPGRGKTTTIETAPAIIGKALGKTMGIVIINGGLLTPMDVLGFGLPKHHPDYSEMVFSEPFFWRTDENKRLQDYDGGIIFIDEADKMDTDVKKCMGEGALSGRIGAHRLPPGWVIWMAGNRTEDRSGSTKELDHLINRRVEIDITDDIKSWDDWAITAGVMPLTRAFANQNPNLVFTDKVPEKQGPWCTPRSLVAADKFLSMMTKGGRIPDSPSIIEQIGGMIGGPTAAQYFGFVRLEREMPKFETIVANPKTAKVPEKPDAVMLAVYNLAHRVEADTIAPVIEYVTRLPKEFAVTFTKAACRRQPMLVVNPAIREWASTNSALMAALHN